MGIPIDLVRYAEDLKCCARFEIAARKVFNAKMKILGMTRSELAKVTGVSRIGVFTATTFITGIPKIVAAALIESVINLGWRTLKVRAALAQHPAILRQTVKDHAEETLRVIKTNNLHFPASLIEELKREIGE